MKKYLALCCSVFVLLTTAACTTDKNDQSDVSAVSSVSEASSDVSSKVSSEVSAEVSEASSDLSSVESVVTEIMTMEEYIETFQSELEAAFEGYEEMGLAIEAKARGNSFVYSFKYLVEVTNVEEVKAALEEAAEAVASVYEMVLADIKNYVPDAESVIVEYLNSDESVILSTEYK